MARPGLVNASSSQRETPLAPSWAPPLVPRLMLIEIGLSLRLARARRYSTAWAIRLESEKVIRRRSYTVIGRRDVYDDRGDVRGWANTVCARGDARDMGTVRARDPLRLPLVFGGGKAVVLLLFERGVQVGLRELGAVIEPRWRLAKLAALVPDCEETGMSVAIQEVGVGEVEPPTSMIPMITPAPSRCTSMPFTSRRMGVSETTGGGTFSLSASGTRHERNSLVLLQLGECGHRYGGGDLSSAAHAARVEARLATLRRVRHQVQHGLLHGLQSRPCDAA